MRIFTLLGVTAALAFSTFGMKAADVEYTLNPKANSILTEINEITISFPNGEMVGYHEVRPAVASLENLSTGEVWYCVEPSINRPDADGIRSITFGFSDLGSSSTVSITDEGEYLLSIKGLYTSTIVDGEETEPEDLNPITANYKIVYPVVYSLDPSSGSTVEDLSIITLTFAPGSNVGYYDARPGVGVLENLTSGNVWYCEVPDMNFNGEGEKVFTFNFAELGEGENTAVNEAGEYTFTVRGLYTTSIDDDGEESEPEDLPVISANYTIVYPVKYTLNPASGENLDVIDSILISFEEGSNVGFYEDIMPAGAVLENLDSGNVWYCVSPSFLKYDDMGNKIFVLEFTEFGSDEIVSITEVGDYKLTLRGLYTTSIDDDGEESEPVDLPNITANYTIQYPLQYFFTPSDGSEVLSLSEVLLTFIDNPMVGISEEVRPAPVVLENLNTEDVWYCENPIKNRIADGSSEFTITFSELGDMETSEITLEGEYLLTVKGIFVTELDAATEEETDTELPDITATFFVSENAAIHSIFNNDNYTVYGINGIQLLKNANPDALKSLNPGLYIINGKKVIVRR